jgi:tRNA nucleotidyltransferase (CCA-adding enzyme)
MPSPGEQSESLGAALDRAYPELAAIRDAADAPVYLVGGAVRDLLLGRPRGDVDVVVEGDAAALAARLGAEPTAHDRFGTAKVVLDGHEVDVAAARRESYPAPGALPVVTPGASIEADLGRRDFTINAMAVPLRGEAELIDPHGGRADLEAGLLRVLHPASFADDPTRALRAARYAARFGFALEPGSGRLLRAADLGTVSADRRRAELLRLAGEATAPRGFELLGEWGLLRLRAGGAELAARVGEVLDGGPWRGFVPRGAAVLAAAAPAGAADERTGSAPGPAAPDASSAAEETLAAPGDRSLAAAEALAAARPQRPSEAVALARARTPLELVLARARGAEWLDRWLTEWSRVELEISGEDLLAAGVPQGPALGRGLEAALAAKLDGEISGPSEELATALAATGDA